MIIEQLNDYQFVELLQKEYPTVQAWFIDNQYIGDILDFTEAVDYSAEDTSFHDIVNWHPAIKEAVNENDINIYGGREGDYE